MAARSRASSWAVRLASAAFAASWGFMLPAGTGPNAIAWATRRIRLGAMVRAGALLDVVGIVLIVAVVWGVRALM